MGLRVRPQGRCDQIFLFHRPRHPTAPRGLPLGELTSQLLANVYLDQLDHFIKDTLGVRYYVRYMDDFMLLHRDKAELWRLLAEIRDFLAYELRLNLNNKTRVFPASHGVDFAGYRHWASHKLPRKRNVRRARKRFFAGLSRCYAAGVSIWIPCAAAWPALWAT
ncbi:RNA-directed DNA polymerase [uncultured Mailhella sp.]|uniref:RNA-directed DNA polymerase n=1 Tax=uncultured Mailhella sp. TaxID=1981031 RepID=UPI002601D43D|nr:RNA-directed DNA polymerase [uncultured Mailhella sp.]